MKLAILSDLHGNQYALSEVLKEVDHQKIDQLLILGDFVGYYYGVKDIFRMLEAYNYHAIKGNHEVLLANAIAAGSFGELERKYGNAHEMATNSLNEQELNYLLTLPESIELKMGGVTMLICHGAPWGNDFYVYPDAKESVLKNFDSYPYDFIFYGHTHYTANFKRQNGEIINPGSVGQSRQKGGQAYWGVIDLENKKYHQQTTFYNVKNLQKEVLRFDPGKTYNHQILTR